jgi:polysaccharide biosynthesis/export protein
MKTTVVIVISAVLWSIVPASRQLLAQSDVGASSLRPEDKAAPTAGSSSEKTSANNAPTPNPEFKIASGDLLEISIFGADFSCGSDKNYCDARVSGSGDVVLPLIGSVRVAGLTVAQAEQLIAKRLSQGEFYNSPQVTIMQKEYATQGISVAGEVGKPGIYPLLGAHTLLQAISAAGGTTVKAGNDVTIIHKDSPNLPQHADLGSLAGGNTPLVPGDTVVVSKAGIVYVVGDVKQPSGIVMERSGLTVLKAIAMAQGTNPTADLKDAKILRNTPQGKQEIPISIRKIMFDKAPDVELQAEDILFIPNSLAKSAARRSLEAIVQTATGVAIYGRY